MAIRSIDNQGIVGFLGKSEYGVGEGGGSFGGRGSALPELANLVFRADLLSSIAPQVGTGGTFGRGSTVTHSPTNGSVVSLSSGNVAIPSVVLQPSSAVLGTGYQTQGTRKNWALDSEQIDSTWLPVGTPLIIPAIETGLGSIVFGWILGGGANEGIGQSVGIAAASKHIVGSIYCRSLSSDVSGLLTLEGDSGGTPETTTKAITIGAYISRVYIYKQFSAAATGNVRFKITEDAGFGYSVGGGMVENVSDSGVYGGEVATPSPYIKTEGAVAVTASDDLFYPSTNISAALSVGTISIWVNTPYANTDLGVGSNEKAFLSMSDYQLFLGIVKASGADQGKLTVYFGNVQIHLAADTFAANTWRNYIFAWDNSGATINAQLYKNGSQIATNTTSAPVTPAAANFYIGSRSNVGFKVWFLDGIISRVRWWKTKLDSTEVVSVYNLERAHYGL